MSRFTLENFVKDLGLRIGGAGLAVGLIFSLAYIGNKDILGLGSLLDSQGGLLIGAVILMEAFFLVAIITYYLKN
jgi:hypothetical protein